MKPVRIRFQTYEFGSLDIHVKSLRDKQQFLDSFGEAEGMGISPSQWPLFGVVWESSEVLAEKMMEYDIKGKRILEIGCGMALSSLLLNSRDADITATDYHPEVASYLADNVKLNNGNQIPFLRTGWENSDDHALGEFDVLIGADLLYEKQHIKLLTDFIHRHSKPECEVIIVDPGRGHHAPFSKRMVELGYSHSQYKPQYINPLRQAFKGQVLTYIR
ncbi:class I SAM-dependent methyltransferase [Cocleimonas sp. KMM 6892]|uniref:class I SAM-dependent methyltransferase n=1 Tax=unclassified Cocleimonas TaxID=2639732 RepID=UPI002DB87DC3|nr:MULTISPECIES: class I SAM-dependent methyltransferase [unclassified Cocleimonas]MEB8434084.1 class I SAM-dependent methyltransferase [Cocleimonas sp. KMM 6892]MEC4717056.1 class I SAM-dependent methyltransferase [Cocleimonas sp. KMM 6895]MEC4746356.1 class I SAM-dependent methyltransferase [Cocleimonas sp. KMM 6896]